MTFNFIKIRLNAKHSVYIKNDWKKKKFLFFNAPNFLLRAFEFVSIHLMLYVHNMCFFSYEVGDSFPVTEQLSVRDSNVATYSILKYSRKDVVSLFQGCLDTYFIVDRLLIGC